MRAHRVALALYAQFGPGKFPANWWMVLYCVVAYTIISVFLHFYSLKFEGDAFALCLPRRVSPASADSAPGPGRSMRRQRQQQQ